MEYPAGTQAASMSTAKTGYASCGERLEYPLSIPQLIGMTLNYLHGQNMFHPVSKPRTLAKLLAWL